MPATGSHPRPAFVEDWDDDAQTTLSSSRTTANVAVKRSQTGLAAEIPKTKFNDGSDSGYSSKAPTVGSTSTGVGKMAGLKVDTSLQERERHPYSANGNGRRESFSRPSTTDNKQSLAREPPFVHPKGICMTCDHYGYHLELPHSAVQPPTPISPQTSNKPSEASRKTRQDAETKLKRQSLNQSAHTSYSQSPAVQPVYATNSYVQGANWSTPVTPAIYSSAYATPITSTYVGPSQQTSYFDAQIPPEARPSNPKRRSATYGEPVIKQPSREDKNMVAAKSKQGDNKPVQSSHRSMDYAPKPSAREAERRPTTSRDRDYDARQTTTMDRDYERRPIISSKDRDYDSRPTASRDRDYDRPTASVRRESDIRQSAYAETDYNRPPTLSKSRDYNPVPAASFERSSDPRPPIASHRSSRSIDQDRAAMPPPPRKQAEVSRRPSLKKSSTYNPETIDHRRSRTVADYDYVAAKVPPSPRAREASPSRPPTSYRGPPAEDPLSSRPQPSRKSVSYSDPITTTNLARTPSTKESKRRSITDPTSSSMERKTADAEAYQRSRSKMTSEELTLEKLNNIKRQRSHTESSQTGSAYSHRESHHSSSRGSSGRGRSHTNASGGQRTSILIDKAIKLDVPADYERSGRPLSIELGSGMTLSFGGKDNDKDKKRDSRMIEKAPSVASRDSKKASTTTTTSSYEVVRSQETARSSQSRRPSHDDERRPRVVERSQRSSRQGSRAPSMARDRERRRESGVYEGGYSAW